jgi:DNA-directed RNA polymerase subunit RPC12/RpoP
MSGSADSRLIEPYRCRDCGSKLGFRSRRRTLAERFVLPLFLLKPVRCGECLHRDYRLVFTPVHERGSELPRKAPKKQPATSEPDIA